MFKVAYDYKKSWPDSGLPLADCLAACAAMLLDYLQ